MTTDQGCPACGRSCSPEDAFCTSCGSQIRADLTLSTSRFKSGSSVACRSCNSPVTDEMSFCSVCGAPQRSTDTGAASGRLADLRELLEEATRDTYQIIRHLGSGGMGSVFLALDRTLHRHVAIKVMAAAPHAVERFRTEARIVAALRHPAIVNIDGFHVFHDLYYFVMDYVQGETLGSVIRKHGPLPVEAVQAVLYDLGSALQHAHSRGGGLIHRDIKPSNIILGPSGHAFVMDFGISKAADAASGLTLPGMVIGTPEYMSPEQVRGEQVSAASDQYSLGLVGYAMLTGAPPFVGQYWSVLSRQASESPTPIRELRPDCPHDVAEAIERMISKSARDRWPDVMTAVRGLGGRPMEEGDPARIALGSLVRAESPDSAPKTVVAGLSIQGLPDQVVAGDTITITATPVDALGRPLPNRVVTVESMDPKVLELVAPGSLRALVAGSARVVVRCEGAEFSQPIHVTSEEVTEIGLEGLDRPVHSGDRLRLTATVRGRAGKELPGKTIIWASSDAAVAEVSRTGELVARQVGSTTIFASCEGRSALREVKILPAAVPSSEEVPETLVVPVPDNPKPAKPARTVPSALEGRNKASSTPRPRRPVSAVVPLAVVGILFASAAVGAWHYLPAVAEPPSGSSGPPTPPLGPKRVVSVEVRNMAGGVARSGLELQVGETLRLRAEPLDEDGQPLVDRSISWSSSNDLVAEVSADGRITATRAGDATLVARSEGVSGSVSVRVLPLGPKRVVSVEVRNMAGGVARSGLELQVGETLRLRAEPLDEDGQPLVDRSISWSSSNDLVAEVSADGRITATRAGDATLVARSEGVSGSVSVRVLPPPPGRLSFRVSPVAGVYVQGEFIGEFRRRAEPHEISLPVGPHEIVFRHPDLPDCPPVRQMIIIRSGETLTLEPVALTCLERSGL